MSRGWQRSDLKIGEEIRIPSSLFITGTQAVERLISVTYIGEVDTGILVDCKFKASIKNIISDSTHYRMMIPWASIYCGHVSVYRDDSTSIVARRIKKDQV